MRAISFAAAAFLALGGQALGMAGGGYGGNMQMAPNAGFDDYGIAVRLIKHQEFASAIPHLETALKQRPQSADILNYLGYAHRMVGAGEQDPARAKDFQDSLAYYEAALAIDPMHKGVHEYLGELFLQMNNLNAAHHEMNELVILCPDGCAERDTLAKALADYAPPRIVAPAPQASPAPTP
jgi:tetratricopeptide (TPR) repeat protein